MNLRKSYLDRVREHFFAEGILVYSFVLPSCFYQRKGIEYLPQTQIL